MANENLNDLFSKFSQSVSLGDLQKLQRELFWNNPLDFYYCRLLYDAQGKPNDFVFLEFNPVCEKISKISSKERVGKKWSEVNNTKNLENNTLLERIIQVVKTGLPTKYEMNSGNGKLWFLVSVFHLHDDYFAVISEDIIKYKSTENPSEENDISYQNLIEALDAGYSRQKIKPDEKNHPLELVPIDDQVKNKWKEKFEEVVLKGISTDNITYSESTNRFSPRDTNPFMQGNFANIFVDRTEKNYHQLFNAIEGSFSRYKLLFDDQNRPIDYIAYDVNDAFEKITGFKRAQVIGKRMLEVSPGLKADTFDWLGTFAKVAITGQSISIEQKSARLDRYYSIHAYSTKPGYFDVLSFDITERKRLEEEIHKKTIELERSNEALEKFTYSASHDLQEPLRTITNFVQLFETKYKNQLDDKANLYIKSIVNGSNRIKKMVQDLLNYSRIQKKEQKIESIDLNNVIKHIIIDLDSAIKESNTKIILDKLPEIGGFPVQIDQLFQNLVANSIKFRRKNESPEIHIGLISPKTEHEQEEWHFYIQDNGIGIEPQYFDQLFVLFQRLHTQDQYPGSGIGLATCKKIVENHGGRIWVESEYGKGSTFHFTLQK